MSIKNRKDNLHQAIALIGTNDSLRSKIVATCQLIEQELDYPDSIRDDITGPIIDALHRDAGTIRKELKSGLIFDFHYGSKIARDFVMSTPKSPDHVWEPQTTKLLLYLTRCAKNVIVGGAYFGDHAILIANQLAACGGVCHAFEPHPDNSEMLIHNAHLNRLENIRVHQLGLWNDSNSFIQLIGNDAYASSESVVTGAKTDQSIKTITIDHYLKKHRIDKIDLLMLDVEGAEYKALQGASGQLALPAAKAPNIIFEIHRNYVDWTDGLQNTDLVKYLVSFGYEVYAVRDFHSNFDMEYKPIELITPEHTFLEGPPHGFNMLAVKDKTIVQDARFKFCQGVSPKLILHKDPSLHHPLSE